MLTTTVSPLAEVGLEPVGELRPADPAGQLDDPGSARPGQASARSAPTSPIRSIVSRSYGAGRRTMIVRKPSSTYGRIAVGDLVRRAEEVGHVAGVRGAVVGDDARPGRLGLRRPVAEDDREADRHLDLRAVAADVGAVPVEVGELAADLVEVARRVPAVRPEGHGPEGLPGSRAADEDRQVGLDRRRRAERVAELVEAALVGDGLAVEQAPDQPDGLVEPVEPLRRRWRRDRCRRPRAPGRTRPRRSPGRPARR